VSPRQRGTRSAQSSSRWPARNPIRPVLVALAGVDALDAEVGHLGHTPDPGRPEREQPGHERGEEIRGRLLLDQD
jgi:hypothetical protein